jgi:hypothetical protein
MVNTRQPADERIAALSREISRRGAEKVYLKPAVRAEIERWAIKDVTTPPIDSMEDGWNQTC